MRTRSAGVIVDESGEFTACLDLAWPTAQPGLGGFASRQTVTAGNSVHLAAQAVREKALKTAALLLDVPHVFLDSGLAPEPVIGPRFARTRWARPRNDAGGFSAACAISTHDVRDRHC